MANLLNTDTIFRALLDSAGTGLTMGVLNRIAFGDPISFNKTSLQLMGLAMGSEAISSVLTPMFVSKELVGGKLGDFVVGVAPSVVSGLTYAMLDNFLRIDGGPFWQIIMSQIISSAAAKTLVNPIFNALQNNSSNVNVAGEKVSGPSTTKTVVEAPLDAPELGLS